MILVGLLAGCAKYQPRPLAPAQTESDFRARSLADSEFRKFVEKNSTNPPSLWPPKEFDLSLLTLAAFYFHPDLQLARAKIAVAQAGEITAGERPNPSVTLLPTYVPNADAALAPWLLTFSWDIPIETAGKRGHRILQAQELTLAARLALGEAAWKVRSRLRAAFVENLLAQRELEPIRDELQLRSNLVQLLQKRLELGDVSRVEINLAQTDFLTAQLAFRGAEGRIAETRANLSAALGLPNSALEKIHFVWPRMEKTLSKKEVSSASFQNAGLLNRLDIRRSLAEYAASEKNLQLEIAKQYPDLHLSPGYEFDQGEHKFSLGPSLTLPILNQNQGAIAQAKAKREEAAATFLSLQAQAINETEKALVNYRAAISQWAEADKTLNEMQSRIEKSTRSALELGEVDRATLLNVQLQKLLAMRARLDALRKVQAALGALEDAVQRPILDDGSWNAFSAVTTNPNSKKGNP